MAFRVTELKEANMTALEPVPGHAVSLLPADRKWNMIWNDEFDGDRLDETKWMYRLNFWGKPHPAFSDKGVHLDGQSHMFIDLVREEIPEAPGVRFSSAHLQTAEMTFDNPKDTTGFWPFGQSRKPLFLHKYGFYEICCKLPHGGGWHAAFWLQSPCIGAHPDPRRAGVEVDIMENYRLYSDGEIVCGNGWGGYGKDSRWYGHFKFPFAETPDGWHRYAVDWRRDGYVFYADGKEVGRQMAPECPVSDVEQFVLVSTECHGYLRRLETEAGMLTPGTPHPNLFKAWPDTFEVDYVRVFDPVE